MKTEHHDDSLTPTERLALERWADADATPGFADRVLAAWDAEREAENDATEPRHSVGGGRKATVIAIVSAVFAAAAVLAMWARAHASASAIDPAAEGATAVADASAVRAKARAVLVAHCTPCHEGTATGSDPAALRVFDVTVDDWWSMPTAAALPAMNDRMAGRDDATATDRGHVAAFVDDELRRRASSG